MTERSLVDRLIADRLAHKGRRAPPDSAFRDRWPHLFELVTTELREGPRVHDPATLSVRCGDGEWIVTVSVGYLAQSASASGCALDDAYDRLEAALAGGTARWSLWKDKAPRVKPAQPEGNPEHNGRAKPRRRK